MMTVFVPSPIPTHNISIGTRLRGGTFFKNSKIPSKYMLVLGYSWRSIIAAEMIAASSGLGYMINFARQMSRIDRVIVGIIMIGCIGYLTDFIFVKIATRCLKGDLRNEWYNS